MLQHLGQNKSNNELLQQIKYVADMLRHERTYSIKMYTIQIYNDKRDSNKNVLNAPQAPKDVSMQSLRGVGISAQG